MIFYTQATVALRQNLANHFYCFMLQACRVFVQQSKSYSQKLVTAAIPVTRFGRKVLPHRANSIEASNALLIMESNLIQTPKFRLIMTNAVATATGFLE